MLQVPNMYNYLQGNLPKQQKACKRYLFRSGCSGCLKGKFIVACGNAVGMKKQKNVLCRSTSKYSKERIEALLQSAIVFLLIHRVALALASLTLCYDETPL